MGLHPFLNFVVGKIFTLVNEGLTILVVCSVIEVLRLKGSGIDYSKAVIVTFDDVLFG